MVAGRLAGGEPLLAAPVCERGGREAGGSFVPIDVCEGGRCKA